MFGQRAAELIRELERTPEAAMPPYKAESIRAVCDEIKAIYKANQDDTASLQTQSDSQTNQKILHSVNFRHIAMERNKRCLIAYHYNRMERLKNLRWSSGGIIPANIRLTCSEKEVEWFSNYNQELANYMTEMEALDLSVYQRPPKEHFIDVKVLMDYGNYETEDGETIFLKKHMRLCMARTECEHLIRQGVLQHVQ